MSSQPVMISIEYYPDYRSPWTPDDAPGRQGWVVTCPEHPSLGKIKDESGEPHPWGYASAARARGVATRHGNARHSGQQWRTEHFSRGPGEA